MVRFSIRDKVSGIPLDGLHPAAWLDLHNEELHSEDPHGEKQPAAPVPCKERVQKLLNASALSRPEIDLNSYYVLVMNDNASISVIDPQFSYGASRVIASVPLASPGGDWQFSGDQKLLFVSMPSSGKIAVIDTSSWQVLRSIDVGAGISRISLQPDGRRIWVAYGEAASSGAAAIDVARLQIAGNIQTGIGPHEVAFSTDGRLAFVTNQGAGTVSVIDAAKLTRMRDIHTGQQPDAVAFSAKSGFAYVTDAQDGTITVLDGTRGVIVTTIAAESGVGAIRFARDGRFGIVLNTPKKLVHVLDTSLNRIIQTGDAEGQPDQVTFSGTLAYVRQRGSESVLMVPLDSIGAEHKPLPEAEFPAGQHALGQVSLPTPADSIVQAPGENAVLVANPGDHSVYYYEEGMAAPMGFFTDHSREPRALLALDRSLKESSRGVYQTTAHLERPGMYTMALLLDSPPAVQCWDVVVEPDPTRTQPAHARLEVQSVDGEAVQAGVPVTFHFRIWDADAKTAKAGVPDVKVLIFRAPGGWHQYKIAKALDKGIYEVTFPALQPGVYYLNMASAGLGLTLNSEPIILRVVAQ
jgi:YVTN family beta-propeller protein